MIVLAPASVQEMAELTAKGFDLADKYRMTCMILADGTVGQMMEPVELPVHIDEEPDRPWAVTGTRMNRPHHIYHQLPISVSGKAGRNEFCPVCALRYHS